MYRPANLPIIPAYNRFNYFPALTPIPVLPFPRYYRIEPILATFLSRPQVISVDQSTNQSMSQSTNQATIAPTYQSMDQPTNQRTPLTVFTFLPLITVVAHFPVSPLYHFYHVPVLTGLTILPFEIDQSMRQSIAD